MTAARTDANQRDIVAGLRAVGATVHCMHGAAHGFPDLVVGFQGVTYLLEIKSEGGRLTPDQLRWHAAWRGQVAVVRTVDDALQVIGAVETVTPICAPEC